MNSINNITWTVILMFGCIRFVFANPGNPTFWNKLNVLTQQSWLRKSNTKIVFCRVVSINICVIKTADSHTKCSFNELNSLCFCYLFPPNSLRHGSCYQSRVKWLYLYVFLLTHIKQNKLIITFNQFTSKNFIKFKRI